MRQDEKDCCHSEYCCLMPHSTFILLPNILASVSAFSSLVVHFLFIVECTTTDSWNFFTSYWGVWFDDYEFYDQGSCYNCNYYDTNSLNTLLKASRAGALLATIIGVVIVVAQWPTACCIYHKNSFGLFSFLSLLCFITQLFPLFLLISSSQKYFMGPYGPYYPNAVRTLNCSLSNGGIFVIVVAVFWLINACLVLCIPNSVSRNTQAPPVIQTQREVRQSPIEIPNNDNCNCTCNCNNNVQQDQGINVKIPTYPYENDFDERKIIEKNLLP